jgi:hypothetical protein
MDKKAHRPLLTLAVGLAALMLLAGSADARRRAAPIITLIDPAADIVVTQNDPATGCTFNPTYGYGYMITFDWSSSKPVVNKQTYTLTLQHGSNVPIVLDGLTTSTEVLIDCNSFVIDANLSGWHWQVSQVSGSGRVRGVSAQRAFSFGPCRLSSGQACNAAP